MDINVIRDKSGEQKQNSVPISERAFSLIIEQAKELVKRLIETRGHDMPPFSPHEFAPLQRVTSITEVDLGKASGLLLKLRSGYIIKVNKNHYPVRKNFSSAHEIGHIMYNELKLERYVQSIEYRAFNPHGEREIRSKLRERLCDAVATELLMPEEIFSRYLSIYGLSINSVDRLAKTFMVSVPAAAIRMAETSERPCIVVLWKNVSKYKSKTLRFDWAAGPGKTLSKATRFVPVTKQVEAASSQYKAYISDNPVISYQLFKKGNITTRCRVESKGFGYDENRSVISLALPITSDTK